jgi:hypothetical protein
MRKSFELCCASASSHSANADETPVARQVLDAMKAAGQNPDLAELAEAIFQRHDIRLSKAEVARQLDGRRQGHSGTSARAHLASCAAAEASANVRNAAAGCNLNELHTTALEAHETAAKAHMDACIFHGKAGKWHSEKIKNAAVEISEPEDEETTEIVND